MTFNNTDNIYKHQLVLFKNKYKINKTHNVKTTYYDFTNDVGTHKHNTINTNGTYNVIKLNWLILMITIILRKIEHNSNITNDITRHNHINCEHNVIKKVQKHSIFTIMVPG